MTQVSFTPYQQLPPHHWDLTVECPHGASSAQVWLNVDLPDVDELGIEAYQNHQRFYPSCDCAAPPVAPKVAHMASDRPMPEVDTSAEWDVIENYPRFTVGETAAVDGLGRLTVLAVNQSSLGRLTLRNDGADGNQPPGTLAYAGTLITAEGA
jgi:hypothetical protein